MRFTAVLLLCLAFTASAQSEIVVTQDENGKIIVSNRPSRTRTPARPKTGSGVSPTVVPTMVLTKIKTLAEKYKLREDLIIAVARAESSFDPYAVSRKGAIGLMQLMFDTARKYGVVNRFNVDQNLEAGIRHLKYLYDKYRNSLPLTLAAYNAGESAVKKYGGVPPYSETRVYIKRVMGYMGLGYSGVFDAKPRTKLYKYTTRTGRIIITDRLPATIDGSIEVLE